MSIIKILFGWSLMVMLWLWIWVVGNAWGVPIYMQLGLTVIALPMTLIMGKLTADEIFGN